jgi:predicted DNA-binding transcriptional regulator AlpA
MSKQGNDMQNKEEETQGLSYRLTPIEVGDMLNISQKSVINLSKKGEIPAYRISERCYRYSEDQIAEYIESKKIGGSSCE